MQTHRMADPFRIPALPRKARRLPQPHGGWEALREACLAGMLGLAVAWTLAELALALGG